MRWRAGFQAALLIVAASAQADDSELKARIPSMTIAASASLEVVPDLATIQLGVVTERATASAAADETARASQAVIDEIKAERVEPRDIKTFVSVSAVFDEERDGSGRVLKRSLRGYTARNSISVRLRDTARAGALARRLIDKGANVFEGIHFDVSDDEAQRDALRVRAMQDAVRRARLYAEAAGVRTGRILDITPEVNFGNEASLPSRRAIEGATAVVNRVIPVEPGVVQLTARVSVVWEIVSR